METLWAQIEDWLAANAPGIAPTLGPPASEDQVESAETELGLTFPPAVRESYRVHNGGTELWFGLFGGWELLGVQQVVQEARRHREAKAEFDIDFDYPDSMLPLFHDGGGNFLYVDGAVSDDDPPLLFHDHEVPTDDTERAKSFSAYLEGFLTDLENGRYEYFGADEQPFPGTDEDGPTLLRRDHV